MKYLIEGTRLGTTEREAVEKAYAEFTADAAGQALVARISQLITRNEYKRRQAPPILRVRGRAFGSGRQMPIAARYEF